MMKLFVGSLAWATDDESLRTFFEQFGTVTKAEVVRERDSHRSRGFGFVEMADENEAKKAIAEGDGKELDGRNITVSESKPRPAGDRPPRFGSGVGSNSGYSNRENNNSFRSRSW